MNISTFSYLVFSPDRDFLIPAREIYVPDKKSLLLSNPKVFLKPPQNLNISEDSFISVDLSTILVYTTYFESWNVLKIAENTNFLYVSNRIKENSEILIIPNTYLLLEAIKYA